ncbi:hypothetical protein [Roseobacter sp. S98]|uniref:hypothetical protein n=1 Tax=Roseobacter algicola (ex Choi et al. 2025) (nom. illeg.) TaxID=3092138 RepID=UPI003F51179B
MADDDGKDFEARVRVIIEETLLRSTYRSELNPTPDLRFADIYKTREIIADEIAKVAVRADSDGDLRLPDLQKVRDIVTELVEAAIEPGNGKVGEEGQAGGDSDGGTGIPDINRVREIAKAEIETWQKDRPRWWNIRRRLDTQIASGGLAAILLLALFDVMVDRVTDNEQAVIRDFAHSLAGTAGYVDTNVKTRFERWRDKPEDEPELKAALAAGLNKMAISGAPDFTDVVHRAMRSQPILMFHGEARIGANDPAIIENSGCSDLVWHWQKTDSDILPDAFRLTPEELEAVRNPPEGSAGRFAQNSILNKNIQACRASGRVDTQTSLYLPFWARFHKEGKDKPDQVSVYLSVARARVYPPAKPGDEAREERSHPYPNKLKNLKIEYRPMVEERLENGATALELAPVLTSQLGGFFAADISALVRDAIKKPADRDKHSIFELMHNLEVSREELPEGADCNYSNDSEYAELHAACLHNEVVVIHVFIAVNKNVSQ